MFKIGQVVEVKFSPYRTEICEVVEHTSRDGVLRYQVSYPFNSSSYKYWTEVDASDIKPTNYKPRGVYAKEN
jgi:hypothetical protein